MTAQFPPPTEFAPVSTAGPRFIIAAAVAFGADADALHDACGFDTEQLADRDLTVPYAQAKRAWTLAADMCGDPNFGLHAAPRLRPEAFGAMGFAVVSCERARVAAERMLRYSNDYYEDVELELLSSGDASTLRVAFRTGDLEECRHPTEFILTGMLLLCREVVGLDWDPISVTFAHEKPQCVDDYASVFRCPVHFGADRSEVLFPTDVLERRMAAANHQLANVLHEYVEEVLEDLRRKRGFANEVRRVLIAGMTAGGTGLEETARALGLSPRTLQRRLRSEGTSHRELLDSARERLARRYLREQRLTVDQVAESLGFSEPSAFHRAFRRWTGSTPAAFRSNGGGVEDT